MGCANDVITAALVLWVVLELLFLVVTMLYLAPRMNRLTSPPAYPMDGKRLVMEVLETVKWLSAYEDSAVNLSNFLSGWFLGTPPSELKLGNIWEFLAWVTYAKEVGNLSKVERENVLDLVKVIEEQLGRVLEPGHNPEARCIRHTLDPVVPFSHRPLVLYAVLGAARVFARVVLKFCGFSRLLAPCGRFRYWHRQASTSGSVPMIFFHGVCTGLPSYLLALWRVCRGRTCIVIESPSISMNLHLLRGHTPPTETELVKSVELIMALHGLRQATFFGHSFGSISVAWMSRRRPHLVSQIVLVDPVCLLLFLPDVANAFLHPESLDMKIIEKVVLHVLSREKGTSHTLRRHFWWYQNVLWPQDIHCPAVVGLSGLDKITPAQPIRRFLLSYPSFADTPTTVGNGNVYGECNEKCNGNDKGPEILSRNGRNGFSVAMSGPISGSSVDIYGMKGEIGTVDNGTSHIVVASNGRTHDGTTCYGATGDGTNDQGFRSNMCSAGNGKRRDEHHHACNDDSRSGIATSTSADAFRDKIVRSEGIAGDKVERESRRVELVYWPKFGHGHALGSPRALNELMLAVERQAKAFGLGGS